MEVVNSVWRLKCTAKHYDWGKYGINAEVYRLFKANSGENCDLIDLNKPYAEFWMGTHVSGASYVVKNNGVLINDDDDDDNHDYGVNYGGFEGESLKNWINNHPYVVGDKVLEKWGCDLPFLFKVLSVAKPLSIQAHPCKELAKKLHLRYPKVYKDDNHKPEMALAITKFEILYGFVPIEDLKKSLDSVPEISLLVGAAVVDRVANVTPEDGEVETQAALKQLFMQIVSANDDVVAKVLSQLISRLRNKDNFQLTSEDKLALRLNDQYPGDVGVLAAYLMNFVTLNPGDAVCVGPNELHAYVSGDCIECMATSDNVVRAGLTSKPRDIQTLCELLTYKQARPEIFQGFNIEGTNGYIKKYCPPFEEFEVDHCDLSDGKTVALPSVVGPSIFLVTQGTGTVGTGFSVEKITAGDVLFAPADVKLTVSSETRLQMYLAGVNTKYL